MDINVQAMQEYEIQPKSMNMFRKKIDSYVAKFCNFVLKFHNIVVFPIVLFGAGCKQGDGGRGRGGGGGGGGGGRRKS